MPKMPKTGGQKQERDRRYYACPKSLTSLISFLNMLPPHIDAPFSEALNKAKDEDSEAKNHLKEFQQRFRTLPEEFQAELQVRSADKKKSFDKWRRVNAWCFRFNDWRVSCQEFVDWAFLKSEGLSVSYTLRFSDVLTIGEDGKTQRANNELVDALTNIEATRLRKCRICERLFWATRKDKRGCSRTCCETLKKRRQRKLQKERGTQYAGAKTKKKGNKTR